MIGGDRMFRDIKGMDRILDVNPQFGWNDIKYLERFEYFIDLNDYGEEVSYFKALFKMKLNENSLGKVWIKFNEVNNLKMNSIGGKYNQIMGFEVIDQLSLGWEQEQRYVVREYENGTLEFFCKSIEIL